MKTILLLLFAGLLSASAADIQLAWDESPTTGVTNYVLYASTNALNASNLQTAAVRLNVGTNLTATVEDIQPGQWSFAATAQKMGVESAPSNILLVDVPTPPARMRTVIVQYSGTLTNFYDVGFFRLKLP